MKKVIGIVAEGPTDHLVLKAAIDRITGEENRYLSLQPEPDMMGRYGNGWKGVWRWCRETASINMFMQEIQPNINAIVIQMDGDVIRKEREPHCLCESTVCVDKGKVFPLYCERVKDEQCPVELPCISHKNSITGRIDHGVSILAEAMGEVDMTHISIVIPCDSTDAWVVAAYDDIDDVESLADPWKNVIAKKKYYHGIRVRDKKNTIIYKCFSDRVADEWCTVTEKCSTAMRFEQEVKRILMDDAENQITGDGGRGDRGQTCVSFR